MPIDNKTPQSSSSLTNPFSEKNFPYAVGQLLELNNYIVEYDVHVHGAQIDIVAKSKHDPFSPALYIEVTIEYVSTEKYGKDTTKFILLKHKNPGSTCLCISSEGFTAPVKERAKESGIIAMSYRELFTSFEKFSPYVNKVLADTEIAQLVNNYEEPLFNDSKGNEFATKWLKFWRSYSPDAAKWLIVLGEYGTGKTSLTKVLQYRWLQDYLNDASNPIPVRIELRNFSRQFDAQGLLHHFLDSNGLSHVPIQFVNHLIRTGRMLLILDGYDEMAQFLNARERRACLSALAELSADGAKGILTSRPNYFTEAEELNVFEALYTAIEHSKYHISRIDRSFVAQEKDVDELVGRYVLNRYERSLQDLTPEQTIALIKRTLSRDPVGQAIILEILKKLFRGASDGGRQSLSGKPVIITYLLELIDEIRGDGTLTEESTYTEWQIYKMIVDRLMLRDMRRSALSPDIRRKALQRLATTLSYRDNVAATEDIFRRVIEEVFKVELRRMQPEDRRTRQDELFEDLRSSATLTRASNTKEDSWIFSHNSLREFLVSEFFLGSLFARVPMDIEIPITSAMRTFVAALLPADVEALVLALSELWPRRSPQNSLGNYLSLIWRALSNHAAGIKSHLKLIAGDGEDGGLQIGGCKIDDVDFSDAFKGNALELNASGGQYTNLSFDGIVLNGASFEGSILDTSSFCNCALSGANFRGALVFECDFRNALVRDADFRQLDPDSNIKVHMNGAPALISGKDAVGYLKFNGAITDEIDDYAVYRNHPKFAIIYKIAERIAEQKNSQLRGLTQRGESRADPPFARSFLDKLRSSQYVTIDQNELVSPTPEGRNKLIQLVSHQTMSREIADFLDHTR